MEGEEHEGARDKWKNERAKKILTGRQGEEVRGRPYAHVMKEKMRKRESDSAWRVWPPFCFATSGKVGYLSADKEISASTPALSVPRQWIRVFLLGTKATVLNWRSTVPWHHAGWWMQQFISEKLDSAPCRKYTTAHPELLKMYYSRDYSWKFYCSE